MARYAAGTTVAVEKSVADLRSLVRKHGATEWAVHEGTNGRTTVVFMIEDIRIKQTVTLPSSGNFRNDNAMLAEERRLWRVLLFGVKAKLTLINEGGSTISREFLADAMQADGSTVGETLIPHLRDIMSGRSVSTIDWSPVIALGAGEGR